MTVSEQFYDKIMELMQEMTKDLNKIRRLEFEAKDGKPRTAAACKRVRVNSLKLTKLMKEFRKATVA